jgi:transposase
VPCFGGLDGTQAQVDVARRPAGKRRAVAHAARGVETRVAWVQTLPPTLLVREATGGLERAVPRAWAAAGLPVVVVPPRQARAGARATGPVAHTAAVEARAPCAAVIRPTPRPLPDAQTHARRALVGRRPPRSVMRS